MAQKTEETKLGLGMSESDKYIEELEDILAGVMSFIDRWLEGADFSENEVTRASIAHEKVLRIIEAKDKRIRDLENELHRVRFGGLFKRGK